jgi:hypothetical protein
MGGVVKATSRPLYPRKRDSVSTVRDMGRALAPVWTDAEYLAPIEIRYTKQPFTESIINICIGIRHNSCICESRKHYKSSAHWITPRALPREDRCDARTYNHLDNSNNIPSPLSSCPKAQPVSAAQVQQRPAKRELKRQHMLCLQNIRRRHEFNPWRNSCKRRKFY